jgi:hypothetical protein
VDAELTIGRLIDERMRALSDAVREQHGDGKIATRATARVGSS